MKPENEAVSHLIMKSIYPLHSFILPLHSFWRTNLSAPTCLLVNYILLPNSSQWCFFPLQHPCRSKHSAQAYWAACNIYYRINWRLMKMWGLTGSSSAKEPRFPKTGGQLDFPILYYCREVSENFCNCPLLKWTTIFLWGSWANPLLLFSSSRNQKWVWLKEL